MPLADINLDTRGLDLDSIWEGFIEQIAFKNTDITIERMEGLSVEEMLNKQDAIMKLHKEIAKLERLSRSEKQPKKRFELYTRLQVLQRKLAEEKGE